MGARQSPLVPTWPRTAMGWRCSPAPPCRAKEYAGALLNALRLTPGRPWRSAVFRSLHRYGTGRDQDDTNRLDELPRQQCGVIPYGRRLRRPHSQRREAHRSTSRAAKVTAATIKGAHYPGGAMSVYVAVAAAPKNEVRFRGRAVDQANSSSTA